MSHPQPSKEFLREPPHSRALGKGARKGVASILLTQGYVALVDEADHERVSKFKWRLLKQGKNMYAQAHVRKADGKKTTVSLHRFVMEPPDGTTVDHVSGNGLDCRRSNLRLVSYSQNLRCQRKPCRDLPSGVYLEAKGRYRVRVWLGGKGVSLGTYGTLHEATRKRDAIMAEEGGGLSPAARRIDKPKPARPKRASKPRLVRLRE
jgi:hypothetical protein